LCAFQIFPNIFVHVAELGLEGNILYSMVLEQIVAFLVDLIPGLVYVPLLRAKIKILAPSRAIYGVPSHLIYALFLEKYVVLDHI